MVDVVGLRFVSEGGEKAVQDLNRYKNAQNDLASATQKNITFSQRNAAQLRSVAQAYASGAITLREAGNLTEDLTQRTTALARAAGATDAQLVSLVRRFNEMADAALAAARAQEAAADYERRIAAQMAFNEQLGVAGQRAVEMGASFTQFAAVLDNLDATARRFTTDLNDRLGVTGQRAAEAGASFSLFATVLDNLDASARRFTSDLNDRMGVTGQRATEAGASFAQFGTVLDNLDAAARRFTLGLNDRLGVTGQRATEAGASFSLFATVLDNLDATARRFTADLNQRLGVTGQRAVEMGASFTQFGTVLDNLDATARRFTTELNDRLGVTGQRAIQAGAGYEALEADIRSAEVALDNFRASFDPTAAAARRLENAQTVLANAVRTGAITQEEANRTMQQYRGALDDTAKANELLRRETQALAMAYNPVMAAQTVYERKQQELNRAHELGVLSADKLQAELTQLAAAYNSIGGSTLNAQRFTNQFGENVRLAGIKTNRFGMVAQQVGYQVGDFFVQIQSGTNAFVAFGQQATQLAGLLPGLAGAVVGISISVGTMLLAAWDRARKAQDEAAASIKNLQSELESLDQTLQDWIRTKKASEAGVTVEELLGTQGIEQARADLETATEALAEFQATMNSAAAVGPAAGINFVKGLFDADAASAYENAVRKVIDAHTLLASLQQKQGEEQFANFAEQKRELDQQLALQQEIAQFGRDSAQVRQLELEQEIANRQRAIDQQVQAKDLTEAQGVALKKLVEDVLRQEDALRGSVVLSETFKSVMEGISISGLLSQMDTLNSQLGSAIFGAGTLTARLRGVFEAGVAAAERAAYAQEIGGGRSMGRGGPTAEEIQNYDPRAQIAYTPGGTAGVPLPRIPGRRGGGGGGGGGAVREQEDYLKNLLLEAEQKRKLVGLTEDETRRQEILFELKKRELPLNDARIEQIIETEAQTRLLMEAEEKRQQLMQTVEGHIENAFMSWVDGSQSVEDAFKGMLRNILLAIYQQQVAEPAARAVGGLLAKAIPFLFKADGGAFNKGVEFFANGGVVGSPTMFQHSGGLGVMGEAGPEAIMPLKRGSDGKLGVQMQGGGGGDTINVHQYFQLSANGDDSVRRIVRQEAPRMAEMAKSAVVDAKRRGGSYGRSF